MIACEPVCLDSLRASIDGLSWKDRLFAVEVWSRIEEGLEGGSSGWLRHLISQRTGELLLKRAVELGPVAMLAPAELAILSEQSIWATRSAPTPALSRYFADVQVTLGRRAVFGPTAVGGKL